MQKISTISLYSIIAVIILGWWYLAFGTHQTPYKPNISQNTPKLYQPAPSLSLLDRQELQKALAGDFRLVLKLINDWEIEARRLEKTGIEGVKRLDPEALQRSQLLGIQILQSSKEDLVKLNNASRPELVVDDNGTTLFLDAPYHKFLPQTYVSASFLLALAVPEQIVALPGGLRNQEKLYLPSLTSQIPLDIDRFNSEKIFLAKPEVAFVADYSHPATVQALRNQGIRLFTVKSMNTLENIQTALIKTGNIINRTLEAELLKLFMDAALFAIDNQVLVQKTAWDRAGYAPKILYLSYHSQFALITPKTITGQLLQRLGIVQQLPIVNPAHQKDWLIPIDQEKIVRYKPDSLIISTPNGYALKRQIETDSTFAGIAEACGHNIFFVDDDIQQSPTQYIVLAYYDLADALTHINLP